MANVTWQCDKCGKQDTVYVASSDSKPVEGKCLRGGYHVWKTLQDDRILESQKREKRYEKEELERQKRTEIYKQDEGRRLNKEYLTLTEVVSINDKIYSLALSNSLDIENIARLIRLLLRQHESHTELIYKNVISLGSPFDTLIKEVLWKQINANIKHSYQSENLSFQQKACKYFMFNFLGFEYEIFTEFLKDRSEFLAAINDEIKIQKIRREQFKNESLKEISELNQAILNHTKSIHTDKSNYKIKNTIIAIVNIIFGEYTSEFPPRLVWYIIIGYLGSLYFFKIKFSLYPSLILLAIGFILGYIIIKLNKKNDDKNYKLKKGISDKEYAIKELIIKLEKEQNLLHRTENAITELINDLNKQL